MEFKIKGYINKQGQPRFKVYKKTFLVYHKLYFTFLDVVPNNTSSEASIIEEDLDFITSKDAEEFTKKWYSTSNHYRIIKAAQRSIAGTYEIKYIPKSNIKHIWSTIYYVYNNEFVYDNIIDCLETDSRLRKHWIQKYFKI